MSSSQGLSAELR